MATLFSFPPSVCQSRKSEFAYPLADSRSSALSLDPKDQEITEKLRKLFGGPRASTAPYQLSRADLAYRDVCVEGGRWFRRSKLLRAVSREHLAGLARENQATNNAGMKVIFDAEFSRRNFAAARLTDRVALTCALLISIALVFVILN